MFVALRDLRFARGRFVLMGAVVALMTMLVVMLSGLTAGLGRASTSAVTGLAADHLAFAAPPPRQAPSFTDSVVTRSQWRGWSQVPGVTRADPLGITTTRATADVTTSVTLIGLPAGSSVAPRPEAVRDGQVVLSVEAADALGAHVGDEIGLAGQRVQVAAVSGDASFSHTPVVWSGLADWRSVAQAGAGHATVVALTTTAGADLSAADHRLGTRTLTRSDAVSAIGAYRSENGSLQLMRSMLFAISALVIGAFFTVWTIQRTPDVAVLKALGASSAYLLRDAIGQAVTLLALGSALGTGLAVAAGAVAAGAVPFVLSAGSIAAPAAAMVGLGALGAALAIRTITGVDPLTALGSAR